MEQGTYYAIVVVLTVIALAQPWLIIAFNKYAIKPILRFVGETKIEYTYGMYGSSLNLRCDLTAENRNVFMDEISLRIYDSMNRQVDFKWMFFKTPLLTFSGQQELPSSAAHGFLLEKDTSTYLMISFVNVQTYAIIESLIVQFAAKHHGALDGITQAANLTEENAKILEALNNKIMISEDMTKIIEELGRQFLWVPGHFRGEIVVTCSKPQNIFPKQITFEITPEESVRLRDNIEKLKSQIAVEVIKRISNTNNINWIFSTYKRL